MEFTIGDQQNMGFTGNQTITARFDSTNKLEINSKNNSLKIISQTKCSGIDTENIRKNRDETKVQLRKDKRYERANLQRRKVNNIYNNLFIFINYYDINLFLILFKLFIFFFFFLSYF